MKRNPEEAREWLHDLIHGKLADDAIVKGFLKHYVLYGMNISRVQSDIRHYTACDAEIRKRAIEELNAALVAYANAPEPPESRTLEEVHQIVAAVRAGIPMQIDYEDPDEDENPYIVKPCW